MDGPGPCHLVLVCHRNLLMTWPSQRISWELQAGLIFCGAMGFLRIHGVSV